MADILKFTLLLTSLAIPLGAKDHGTHGQTFSIEEEDLIDYIQNRIETLDDSKLQAHYTHTFQYPKFIPGLSEAVNYQVHYFDPTVVTKADIKDEEGKIVIPKGSSYNPLEHFNLTQDLLFFDGDQQTHLEWAKGCGDQTKWILIKGSPFEIEEQENRPIFFDQFGSLVNKLSIKSIPARVTQEGKLLKIEAVPLKESLCAS